MNVAETRVRGLLEGTKQFVVPLFQRSYSWKGKQWRDLWDDIVQLYEAEDDYAHFMGSVVLSPAPSLPSLARYVLIDGQQRITTIMILLAVVRDLDGSEDKLLAQEIRENYLNNRFYQGEDRLKLLPTQVDRRDFESIIDGPPRNYSYGLLGAYKFFREAVRARLQDKDAPYDLRRFFSLIVGSLNTVQIGLSEKDNPYLIFETLNAKGTPLTAADLIRNYIFMRIPNRDEQQSAYETYWLPMQLRLRDEGKKQRGAKLTTFMRVVVMGTGVMVRKEDTYVKLQRYLDRTGAGSIKDELAKASRASELYLEMIDPAKTASAALGKQFEMILNLEVSTSHPLVLKLYGLHAGNNLSESDFLTCLNFIESFMIRRAFCLISTRPLARVFVSFCRDLDEGNAVESLHRLLSQAGWPDDDAFKLGFLALPIYRFDQDKTRFVLKRLEQSYGHREAASLDQCTIEHVFPQSPDDEWREKLGDEAFSTAWQANDRIGNLTLTAYNPSLSNKWFEKKKQIYSESNVQLNRYFENLQSWDAEQLDQRGRALFEKAKLLWAKPEAVPGVSP